MGTSLWDHITTPMAKLAYRKAIDQARDEKRPIVAKFTCDAPEICRELSIEFIAGEDNFVYCLTQVSDMPGTEDNPRPRECAWRDAPRTGAKCERCRFYKLEEAND
ncbi:hypothetical protein KDL45_08910 [bacterium]|nr:hypothetical protein [bacterium]